MEAERRQVSRAAVVLGAGVALALLAQTVAAVITVQIGGATRLSSVGRQRDRYNCYWDCDLVGCQIARDDDECAYDCEKICRVRYDYAARSGPAAPGHELRPKSGAQEPAAGPEPEPEPELANELTGAGTSVRLHLPRNASARNFAIWERCAPDASTGKLTEKPFNL